MPRGIQARENYDKETGRLMQLAQAVALDAKATAEWREVVRSKIYSLAQHLTNNALRFGKRQPKDT